MTKSPLMKNKLQVVRQLQTITFNLQLIILISYFRIKKLSKKLFLFCFSKCKISKLERMFWKSPSQLRFAGEHLLWGTARGVLFTVPKCVFKLIKPTFKLSFKPLKFVASTIPKYRLVRRTFKLSFKPPSNLHSNHHSS